MIINSIIAGGGGSNGTAKSASTILSNAVVSACVFNDEVYALCDNKTFWKFNDANNSWTQLASCTTSNLTNVRLYATTYGVIAIACQGTSGWSGFEYCANVYTSNNNTWTKYTFNKDGNNNRMWQAWVEGSDLYIIGGTYNLGAYSMVFNGSTWSDTPTSKLIPPPWGFQPQYIYAFYRVNGKYYYIQGYGTSNVFQLASGDSSWTNIGTCTFPNIIPQNLCMGFTTDIGNNTTILQNENFGQYYKKITGDAVSTDFSNSSLSNTVLTSTSGFVYSRALLKNSIVYVSRSGYITVPVK